LAEVAGGFEETRLSRAVTPYAEEAGLVALLCVLGDEKKWGLGNAGSLCHSTEPQKKDPSGCCVIKEVA
jgi:hypothetical protein